MGLAIRSCEELAVIWTTKVEFFLDLTKSWSEKLAEFGEDFFFFGNLLGLAGKTV